MIMTDYDEVKVRDMLVKEAREEGKEEGKEEATIENARQMLKYLAPNVISKEFGIPIEKLTEYIQ